MELIALIGFSDTFDHFLKAVQRPAVHLKHLIGGQTVLVWIEVGEVA